MQWISFSYPTRSGVGKSSLARAGVMAAFVRQGWPEGAAGAGPWPQVFHNARQWCFLSVRPGVEPIKALVEAFLETWQFDAGDPARIKQRNEWVELLLDENKKTDLADLLDETERRYEELHQPKPPAFLLYIDQGGELYVRAEPRQRGCFSEILATGLSERRLRALMSLRSDFSGALQNDEALFEVKDRDLRGRARAGTTGRAPGAAIVGAQRRNGCGDRDLRRELPGHRERSRPAGPLGIARTHEICHLLVDREGGISGLHSPGGPVGVLA